MRFQSAGLTQHSLTTVGGESLPRLIGVAPHSEIRFQSKGLTQRSLGQRPKEQRRQTERSALKGQDKQPSRQTTTWRAIVLPLQGVVVLPVSCSRGVAPGFVVLPFIA